MSFIEIEKDIETARLILEPIQPRHADLLYESMQAKELYIYIPKDAPVDVMSLTQRYVRWSKRYSPEHKETWLNYAIYSKISNRYVGTLQSTIQEDVTYIAYEVFPDFWRNGIAKEACLAMIKFLFNTLKVKELKAHVDTRNIASISLLNSLGFMYCERIDSADEFKGSVSDEFVYTLTNPNY